MKPKKAKRPGIICHMLSSVDGKIDAGVLAPIMIKGEYEATAAKLGGDAWICGRTTMEHFAQSGTFASKSKKLAGKQPAFIAGHAKSYAIAVDTLGKLRWRSGDLDGDHLICIVSERAKLDYLADLRKKGISYIVTGRTGVDLADAVAQLREHFGIRTLLLEGGGHMNGGFLAVGLVDELSLLIVPGIDGRHDIPAVFDGIARSRHKAVRLKLKSVEQRKRGALWLRYKVLT